MGSWDIESRELESDGTVRVERRGEWHFAWILGGRGVQDVLFEVGAPAAEYGTTLRCYDAVADVWRVTWMAPGGSEFVNLVGRQVGSDIVQQGRTADSGRLERCTFSDIAADAFTWRGYFSLDDGRSWTHDHEMRARRRPFD